MTKRSIDISDLVLRFELPEGTAEALRGVTLSVGQGTVHGLVGESGSGKTVASLCILGLVPCPPGAVVRGAVMYRGRDLTKISENHLRRLRGKEIAMVFQEPYKHLNPGMRIGEQIEEMVRLHLNMGKSEVRAHTMDLLENVGLRADEKLLASYPHELSGGMCQRVMIAVSVSCGPSFLIADEPTTALDVTLQVQILKLIDNLRSRMGLGVLFISHDLGVVREISEEVSVIYAGKIVENAAAGDLFEHPIHPYTDALMDSIPDPEKRGMRLRAIPGSVPDARSVPSGCAFHPRCEHAREICMTTAPRLQMHRSARLAACHMVDQSWR